MVDLSTVKMPVVEYENGHKMPVDSFDESNVVGWYEVNGQMYHGDGTPVDSINLRITAIHPAEPAADGWVRTEHVSMKQFGNRTCFITDKSVRWVDHRDITDEAPEWFTIDTFTEETLDAAYARHRETKPLLAWECTHGVWHAMHGETQYQVNYNLRNSRWFAAAFGPLTTDYLNDQQSDEAAKAACERHARGE